MNIIHGVYVYMCLQTMFVILWHLFYDGETIDICHQHVVWGIEGAVSSIFCLRLWSILPKRLNRTSGAQRIAGLHRTGDRIYNGNSVRHAGNEYKLSM